MLHLGLLGYNISHSKSQYIYEEILKKKISYNLFDLKKPYDSLENYFNSVSGLSITSPYKQVYLDQVITTDEIKSLSAINCIKFENKEFVATNTDYLALKEILIKYQNRDIIILGNGVMASVLKKILIKNSCDYLLINSTELREKDCINFNSYKKRHNKRVVFNCCSRSFILKAIFDKNDLFYDLNYQMPDHQELSSINEIDYIDGLELLNLQAKFALSFWGISQ